ncbi:MAG TPA: vitamin K epoxide reductase family protein [Gaiellales bacterium]|nr:vitamin K epoxide reductase family protein [Gaiellales bacterium]
MRAASDPDASTPRADRLSWLAVGLALAGLAVSCYLTIVHYNTHVSLACSDAGTIDCQKVTTSPQSMIGGVPVADLGVVFFAVAAVLVWLGIWRSPRRGLAWLRIGWVTAGVCMVLRLLYAELFQIDAICLWCSAVHVLTICLFATVLIGEALAMDDTRREPAARRA